MNEGSAARFRRLAGIELTKLRSRRITWMMALIYGGLCTAMPWMFYLVAEFGESGSGTTSAARDDFRSFASFPGALESSISTVLAFGAPLMMILAAAAFGGEFAWGTLRLMLIRGQGRREFVAAKLAALFLTWAAATAIGVTISLVSTGMVVAVGDFPGVSHVSRADLVTFAGHLAAAVAGGWVYIGATTLATVRHRSTSVGIAVGLVIFFGDRVGAAAAMATSIGPLEFLAKSGINYNLRSLTGGTDGDPNPVGLAVLALAAYLFATVLGSLRQLDRQDVTIAGVG
jgi:ABC-type transport system involved in multi-copper enzyme maturation permease subunit